MFCQKKVLLVFAFALGFGSAQSAFAQWWPAIGTDTTNEWGTGGWGSFVEIYIAQQPLETLMAPVPSCTGNPKNCAQNFIFGATGILGVEAPSLTGLSLDCADPMTGAPSSCESGFTAKITGDPNATPPTVAVCIIRSDAGFLLPLTAASARICRIFAPVCMTLPARRS